MTQSQRDATESDASAPGAPSDSREEDAARVEQGLGKLSRTRSTLLAVLAAAVGFAFAWVTFDLVAALFQ